MFPVKWCKWILHFIQSVFSTLSPKTRSEITLQTQNFCIYTTERIKKNVLDTPASRWTGNVRLRDMFADRKKLQGSAFGRVLYVSIIEPHESSL